MTVEEAASLPADGAQPTPRPARRLPAWREIAWAVGAGPGAGIGLMFVIAGALTVLTSLAVCAIPAIRRLEAALQDHLDGTDEWAKLT